MSMITKIRTFELKQKTFGTLLLDYIPTDHLPSPTVAA
jgi:hypothetical protein